MPVAARPLRCLYYPYSRPVHELTLKKAVLLFDELVVLDTLPGFVRQHLVRQQPDATASDEHFDYLEEQGLLRVVSPEHTLEEWDFFLTAAVRNDVGDDEFCRVALRYDTSTFQILKSRLPSSFFSAFNLGTGTFQEAIALQEFLRVGGDVAKIDHQKLYGFGSRRWQGRNIEELWDAFRQRYRFVIGGGWFDTGCELPFLHGSSLRINEALLVAATSDLVPFTDSPIHDRLLTMKVDRALRDVRQDSILSRTLGTSLPETLPYQHLSLEILNRLLTPDDLAKRTLAELVEYRRANEAELRRLRLTLESVASSVDVSDNNYYQKLRRIVSAEVIPELERTERELTRVYEEAFGKLALKSVQVLVPVITASIFGGLSAWQILGAAALAEAVVFGGEGAEALREAWGTRREIGRTGYAYLSKLAA